MVRAEDIQRETRSAESLPDRRIDDPRELVGMRLVRSLGQGSVWRAGPVEPLPTVQKGDRVKLRIQQGALRIDGLGEAREDGYAGDLIRVRAGGDARELSGRVDAQGVVHVLF